MAYGNYFPQYYQPNPYSMQMNAAPTQATQQVSTQPQQIQNGGFIVARSENEVLNYPVAPGNCVTFKIEGQPIVMEKSMGFSQLEAPHVERYRLVKEEIMNQTEEKPKEENTIDITPINNNISTLNKEIDSIWSNIEKLKIDVEAVKDVMPTTTKRTTSKKDKDGEG